MFHIRDKFKTTRQILFVSLQMNVLKLHVIYLLANIKQIYYRQEYQVLNHHLVRLSWPINNSLQHSNKFYFTLCFFIFFFIFCKFQNYLMHLFIYLHFLVFNKYLLVFNPCGVILYSQFLHYRIRVTAQLTFNNGLVHNF